MFHWRLALRVRSWQRARGAGIVELVGAMGEVAEGGGVWKRGQTLRLVAIRGASISGAYEVALVLSSCEVPLALLPSA